MSQLQWRLMKRTAEELPPSEKLLPKLSYLPFLIKHSNVKARDVKQVKIKPVQKTE